MRSIGFRLGVLVFGCFLIAFAAAGGVIYALHITDKTIDRALDAQRRLDLLTEISGRISSYGLTAIAAANDPRLRDTQMKEAETAVYDSIKAFKPEIASAMQHADMPSAVNEMATRVKPLEQVRGGFRVMVRQITDAFGQDDPQTRGDRIRGAFNGFATMTGPYLFFLMQADRRGVDAAREDARSVSTAISRAALILVVAAFVIAVVMYRLISRPILAAVAEIRDAAVAIGQGERNVRLPVRNRDELGLLAVVFNRTTARLRRRETRVAIDRLALETTIATRTADLRAANDRLAEIDQSRRRFFTDVSHELRTPLTVILGESEIALAAKPQDGADPVTTLAAHATAFAIIRRRAQRLHRRVEDLLRVARSESGTIELRFADTSLRAVCCTAIEAFEGSTRRKDVAIVLEPSDTDVTVTGDAEWLRQVVEGLIDNALRHAKGASLIALACGVDADGAILSVRDDGPGFGVEDPQTLLARFARRASSEFVSGHGIGLALARWVVDKHRGHVTLRAAAPPLNGAEILIHLPLGDV
ncbi:HAMP domain-containing sensor histidine kinase [Beijerinckia sp. L45]|uniref:sensor histidine kinase n=1 Tax=Beijerinckia sp. L45 TaxID=1641855 RepID=UPI00131B185D|nr:HAMP domain-containing sensor histidine kinase [Beijerinckia sp. L45]